MILDENTTRILISEALKDRFSQNQEDQTDFSAEIIFELIVDSGEQLVSMGGQLVDLEITPDSEIIQISANISDAYEFFKIVNKQDHRKCQKYSLSLLQDSQEIDGPFKVSLKKMSSFNYKNNQCTLCVELVKSNQ